MQSPIRLPIRISLCFSRLKSVITGGAVVLLVLWLSFTLWLPPAIAQTQTVPATITSSEDVVIDGRVLFQLGSVDGFTAQNRASSINNDLRETLRTTPLSQPIPIRVVERQQLSTIRINDQHLLTVTDADCMTGVDHTEQAEEWAAQLRAAIEKAQRERSPNYIRTIIVRLAIACAAMLALSLGIRRWRKYLRQRGRNRKLSAKQRWSQVGLAGLQGAIILSLGVYVSELLPQARTARYRFYWLLESAFSSNIISAGEQSYSLLDIAKILALALLLWLGVRGLVTLIKTRFLQTAIPDRGLQDVVATLMQFALMALGSFILLQAWGIDLSALAIFASVLGVGLGFGLQDIVNNFLSGWILLIERPVQVGDLVDVGNVLGSVEKIGARSTHLRTVAGFSIILPNHELVQKRVTNWSRGHLVSRVQLPFCVAYGSVIDQVHQAAIESAYAHPDVLRYPQPQLRFEAFGESSLKFNLLLWTQDPRKQFDVKSDVYYLLEANFRRYSIKIPFPQRDLHLQLSDEKAIANSITASESTKGTHDRNPLEQKLYRPVETKPIETKPIEAKPIEAGAFPANILADITRYSAILKTPKSDGSSEMDRLIAQMLGPEGLVIRDRKFRLTSYPQCFIGTEAVSWIVNTQKATRHEAIRLGQLLVERGVIHHVSDEHEFKDEYLFYRFYKDEV